VSGERWAGERLRSTICVAVGHKLVSGRTFLAEGHSIDLKWKACRRCGRWFPEGGFEQVEHEIEAAVRAALAALESERTT
jgi:hypothetical protein